jgi:hypothetical protein
VVEIEQHTAEIEYNGGYGITHKTERRDNLSGTRI